MLALGYVISLIYFGAAIYGATLIGGKHGK